MRRDPGNRAARDSFTLSTSRAVDAVHPRNCEKSPHIPPMPYHDPNPYRWQDHVVTPGRAAAGLVATVLVVLIVGAAAILAYSPPGPAAHAVAARRMPSLSQQARQPALPRATEGQL